jgi:hypothetical protein
MLLVMLEDGRHVHRMKVTGETIPSGAGRPIDLCFRPTWSSRRILGVYRGIDGTPAPNGGPEKWIGNENVLGSQA